MIYVAFIVILGKTIRYLQIFQLSGYHLKPYISYCKRKYIDNNLLPIIALLGCFLFKDLLFTIIASVVLVFYTIFRFIPSKKRLKWTPRVCRMYVLVVVVCGLLLLLSIDLLSFGLVVFSEFVLIFCNLMLIPVERLINKKYLMSAKEKLENYPNHIIAITGSYGKTSTKNILTHFLSSKYTTLATPKSFNTPLGISRFINDNTLIGYDYLILEYGISHLGDMRRLTSLCKVNTALITDVGLMHLDSLRTIDNVLVEKMSLLKSLHPKGTAVLNYENTSIRNYPVADDLNVVSFGFTFGDYQAKDIVCDYTKTSFNLYIKSKPQGEVVTKLLGRHQVSNILASIALAHNSGVEISELLRLAYTLKPLSNRLRIDKRGDMLVLDDSYNCNLVGFISACEILHTMPGIKGVITPGIVEIKKEARVVAKEIANQLISVADYVVLVGVKETRYIASELLDAKFPYLVVNSFKDGYEMIRSKGVKSLLIANDLPDQYSGGRK